MGIRGLSQGVVTEFVGKNTTSNLSDQVAGTLTAASNVLILADGNVRRAPGYSLVTSLQLGSGPVTAIYDFARSVDAHQFKLYQRGTTLIATDGADQNATILATLASTAPLQFIQSAIACYCSNGVDALRLVDVSGTLTAYQWGLSRPTFTPTLAISPGTLTLTYGRRYVVSPVAKYTDSLGIERIHVGAPTPYSAYTGPQTSSAITLSGWPVPTDPQQTHWWIFATTDSPDQTSATYEFAAEITRGTLAWADTLTNDLLDQTRLAPFDNYPAPPSTILTSIQSVPIAIQAAQIRYAGGSQVVLGIPEESWPLSNFFNLPAGARLATAATVLDDGQLLAVSNGDTWFGFSAYDGSTFTERDRIASPGQAGPLSGAQTPWGYAYLSPSKRLWLWDGSSTPIELSSNVAFSLVGTVGMDDMLDPAAARIHWYSFGQRHFLVVRTATPAGTWLAVFSVPSSGVSGPNSLLPTDKFPLDLWTASADVKEGGVTPFVYAGLADGRIVRFPDTFLDLGVGYGSALSHAWTQPVEGRSRFYFLDLFLDCSDPTALDEFGTLADVCRVSVTVLETAENTKRAIGAAVPVKLSPLPVPTADSNYVLRASLQLPGIASGRYLRWNLALTVPDAAIPFDVTLQKAVLSSALVYVGAP